MFVPSRRPGLTPPLLLLPAAGDARRGGQHHHQRHHPGGHQQPGAGAVELAFHAHLYVSDGLLQRLSPHICEWRNEPLMQGIRGHATTYKSFYISVVFASPRPAGPVAAVHRHAQARRQRHCPQRPVQPQPHGLQAGDRGCEASLALHDLLVTRVVSMSHEWQLLQGMHVGCMLGRIA